MTGDDCCSEGLEQHPGSPQPEVTPTHSTLLHCCWGEMHYTVREVNPDRVWREGTGLADRGENFRALRHSGLTQTSSSEVVARIKGGGAGMPGGCTTQVRYSREVGGWWWWIPVPVCTQSSSSLSLAAAAAAPDHPAAIQTPQSRILLHLTTASCHFAFVTSCECNF